MICIIIIEIKEEDKNVRKILIKIKGGEDG